MIRHTTSPKTASLLLALMAFLIVPVLSHGAATKGLTARQILDRTATELGKSRNITAPFTLTSEGQTVAGTLKMSGDKFFLSLPKAKIWYDGRTQWSLDTSTKEVNISEPMPDELAQVNPMVIISALNKVSSPQLLKGNTGTYSLRLIPGASQHMAFSNAVIDVNQTTFLPTRIILTFGAGQTVTLKIGSIDRTTNHAASMFVFNKADYPGYALIDLR
ncbi:LolA-like putative outer membrane lipoprotein chaperone [uncultured Muribaculum sp.]|uniref:LolA-like putative outer membrane lipoprotein chaperone n=1 Tax=uncultured Muribaculum sp. TaxID=1918613 RepID=UPI0025CE1ACF|nr:LolA-like putative outer membrane lipoprotein chaperone [uncultured Muribaculum sp.]